MTLSFGYNFGYRNYGNSNYDDQLRWENARGVSLTEKEQKDLELWNTIRFYEVLTTLKKYTGWAHYEYGCWTFRRDDVHYEEH